MVDAVDVSDALDVRRPKPQERCGWVVSDVVDAVEASAAVDVRRPKPQERCGWVVSGVVDAVEVSAAVDVRRPESQERCGWVTADVADAVDVSDAVETALWAKAAPAKTVPIAVAITVLNRVMIVAPFGSDFMGHPHEAI